MPQSKADISRAWKQCGVGSHQFLDHRAELLDGGRELVNVHTHQALRRLQLNLRRRQRHLNTTTHNNGVNFRLAERI